MQAASSLVEAWDQAVPPTVILSIRSVGWPTPTGTPWPSLPQVLVSRRSEQRSDCGWDSRRGEAE